MRKFAVALFCVVSAAVGPAAFADQHKTAEAPPSGEMSQAVELQATVTAIDLPARMVTLKTPEGKETTIYVDERARNLPQLRVGDVVKVAYMEALAWQVKKAGKAEPGADAEVAAARTKPGEKPGGGVARRISITATIEAIDLANGTVTLKGPEGNSRTIKARNPANLKKVKVGDLVDITYTEAIAIKVEAAPK
jgi:translation initiation factor IF-1